MRRRAVLTLLTFGLTVLAATPRAAAPEPLHVMTFNIRYGTANDGPDHVSQPAREKSVVLLLDRIARRSPALPVVVTGDFNTGEASPATLTMTLQLRDSFRIVHPGATEVGTANQFKQGMTGGEKIDYIFVQPGAEVLSADIIRSATDGRYPSDHFPVTARIRLR
jgi:endonuclease/exonuclease/phosphatase family metal-dependent hydrolase